MTQGVSGGFTNSMLGVGLLVRPPSGKGRLAPRRSVSALCHGDCFLRCSWCSCLPACYFRSPSRREHRSRAPRHSRRFLGIKAIYALEFSRDGRWLASLSSDGCVMLWDPVTARLERMFSSEGVWSQSIAFSPDGEVLATSGNGSDSVLWNVGSGERIGPIAELPGPRPQLAFLPSGWIVAFPFKKAMISRVNPSTRQVHRLPVARSAVTACIAVARNGETFARGLEDGTIEVWETETSRILATLLP